MTSKYKIIPTALLCMALSPLTHAGVTYCEAGGSYSYGYGDNLVETVECTTPKDKRIYVDQGQTMKVTVTSTRNKTQYQPNSTQVATRASFQLRRTVKWKPDSIFYERNYTGSQTYYVKKDITGTNQFHAKVRSDTGASWAWVPKVSIIVESY